MKMEAMVQNTILFYEHEQLAKFLHHNIPAEDKELDHNILKFYGISKIHKNPVKMHLIVPCHSAMQNLVAKYASKKLKPIVEQLQFCIKGIKDMAMKLSQLQLNHSRCYFLVGFDLVAFYINIPTEDALELCQCMYVKDASPSLEDRAMVRQALAVAFKNLVFWFDGKYICQKNGIAMGIAASPDVANIYIHWRS
jgi:hypothetical protein